MTNRAKVRMTTTFCLDIYFLVEVRFEEKIPCDIMLFFGIPLIFCCLVFQRDYCQAEKGKIILYTSSMTVVRETADKCKSIRHILQTHMVRYEERDLFMSNENQKELLERLGLSAINVPQVFADGVYIGVSRDKTTVASYSAL